MLSLSIQRALYGGRKRDVLASLFNSSGEDIGPEVVTDGHFTTTATGWSSANATSVIVSGELEVTSTASGGRCEQNLTLVAGKTYTVTAKVRRGTATSVRVHIIRGAAGGYGTITGSGWVTDTTTKTISFTFTAPGTDAIVQLACNSAGTGYFDDVSIRSGTAQPKGFYYDPSDFARYMAAKGPELHPDPEFDTPAAWVLAQPAAGSVTISGGLLTVNTTDGSYASATMSAASPIVAGRHYEYEVVVTSVSTGSVGVAIGSAQATITAAGTYRGVLLAPTTARPEIKRGNSGVAANFTVARFSIRELTALDTCTMFQDAAGTTPVTAVEQPVGLILDKSKGLVKGVERAPSDLSLAAWISYSNPTTRISGQADPEQGSGAWKLVSSAAGYHGVYVDGGVVGTFMDVRVKLRVPSGTRSVDIGISDGGGTYTAVTVTTAWQEFTFKGRVPATNSRWINLRWNASGAGEEVHVYMPSSRELPGNHASQSTAASRPVLTARKNLLVGGATQTYTCPLSAAYALSFTGTGSVALSGATTGTLAGTGAEVRAQSAFTLGAVKATPVIASVTTATTGGTIAASTACSYRVVARDGGGVTLASAAVSVTTGAGTGTNTATVNWTKVAGATGYDVYGRVAGSEAKMVSVGDVATWTDDGSIAPSGAVPGSNTTGRTTFTVTGDVRELQLEYGSTATRYQRVTTATDYDWQGFPLWIKHDGVDDWLQTGNIDFTAYDKVTVVVGVHKASDAATGILAELSTNNSGNNGTFRFTVPQGAAATYGMALRGDNAAGGGAAGDALLTISGFTAPRSDVLSFVLDISKSGAANEISARANGVANAGATSGLTDSGGGNFGNYPLYLGRRGGTTLPFNGQWSVLVGVATASPLATTTIQSAERKAASKTGVTIT